jgi:hypothetical protein
VREGNDLAPTDDAVIDDHRVLDRCEPDGTSMSSADDRDRQPARDPAVDATKPEIPPQSYSPEAYPLESYPTQAHPMPPSTLSFPTPNRAESPWARPDPYAVPPYPQPSQQPHYPPYAAYPPYQQTPYPMSQPYRRRNSATGPAAFAFGFLALAVGWVPFFGLIGIAFGVAGAGFAGKAMQLARSGVAADRGLAVVGMALSIIGVGISVAVHAVLFMMFRT